MIQLSHIVQTLLPLFYSGTLFFYVLIYFKKEEKLWKYASPFMLATFVIHTFLIYSKSVMYGRCLVYNLSESMTLISFTIILMYMFIERLTKEKSIGMFFVLLALLFQTLSDVFSPLEKLDLAEVSKLFNPFVGAYVSALIICYTAFTVSALYSVLYLVLHKQISTSKFGLIFDRLPSLQLLDRMNSISVVIGLVFLSLAIFVSLGNGFESILEIKVLTPIIIFIVYFISVLMRKFGNVKSTTAILFSLIGFLITLFSMSRI